MKRNTLIVLLILVSVLLSGCCMHDWQDATCTEPKTCAKCGETDGEKLGHQYSELTCTEDCVCSVCGHVGESAKGHDYVGCVCSVCGEVDQPNFYKASMRAERDTYIRGGETYLAVDSNPDDTDQSEEEKDAFASNAFASVCNVNRCFSIPDSLDYKIANTSMLDGQQSEIYGIIKVTWSYSQYTGLEVMWELCQ